jgi:hypothetical protein
VQGRYSRPLSLQRDVRIDKYHNRPHGDLDVWKLALEPLLKFVGLAVGLHVRRTYRLLAHELPEELALLLVLPSATLLIEHVTSLRLDDEGGATTRLEEDVGDRKGVLEQYVPIVQPFQGIGQSLVVSEGAGKTIGEETPNN